jgi:hypothetical protein
MKIEITFVLGDKLRSGHGYMKNDLKTGIVLVLIKMQWRTDLETYAIEGR